MADPVSESAVSLPVPALRPFITTYAGFRASGFPPGVHHGLPSSDVDLIVSLGPAIDILKMPNARQRPSAFTALIAGLQDAPAILHGGEAFGLHVYIKPLGVAAILGIPSSELASLVVDLSDLWGSRAGALVETLRAADTWPRRFAILDRIFLARLNPIHPRTEIAWAWHKLRQSHGRVPIQQLADETGFSRRHFSERFHDAVGVSPKSAARVFRFKRACRLISDRPPSLAHVALACGYFDQAHMTREWNALAGYSPREWIARQLPFLQDYELGGSDTECDETQSVYQSRVQRPV